MSPDVQCRGACVVCAHNVVSPHKVPFQLLRNDCLPEHTLPQTYDFELYARAILYPKGLRDCWSLSDLLMCCSCHSALVCKHLRQPIRDALKLASVYDLMLIITHYYAYKPSKEGSQRLQESTELRHLLPPSHHELRDVMCVIFSVKQMRPVLTLIDFLLANNPWYQQCGVEYSQSNMDELFDEHDGDMDICHLPKDDYVGEDGINDGDIGDHSAVSREKMKLHALAYVLDHNRLRFLSDNDPGLMSFLFNHCGRTVQQHISMEAQLKNLLLQDDSPFMQDPNFAFICWNMMQKREVSTNTSFRIAADLRDIGPSLTSLAEKWTHSTNAKPSTKEEKKAAKILRRSTGYKLCWRNEIRSLMKKFSTPVSLIPEWSTMRSFARAKVIASRPDATAIAFDLQMQSFIDIILRYKHGPGILGHCKAYYGMVEAQSRGTLHCNPSPSDLRERMSTENGFTDKMFAWLESIISCPLTENSQDQAKKPVHHPDEMDSCLEVPPQAAEMDEDSFNYEFSDFLYHLAIECNWHHVKNGEKKDDTTCRMPLSTIDPETGSIELRCWRGRCNTDTQYIGSGKAAKATIFYTTEYITKTLDYATKMYELNSPKDVDVSSSKKERNLITKSVNAMMGKQEMSHQQIMSYLVGGGDHYSSHTFQTFKWDAHATLVWEQQKKPHIYSHEGEGDAQIDIDAFDEALFADPSLDTKEDHNEIDDEHLVSTNNNARDIQSCLRAVWCSNFL
ncbi:hypothetical protein DFJ58DRAFT_718576 [Suillus subalutaceus]|uniref:uncharacterized protein n=1 Tax=Suillus subalutaceus TaxID=48586 RepID=UPI001B884132|nr:uncharacterized protein DFJ58DRAFT_718576 [Suillus subalutaceus]KAG1839206.1 hypothetical protein DFJ58DRAFT_718576 [Suillus subalutaceus]